MSYDQMTKKADGTLLDWLDSNVGDADVADSIVRWGGTGVGSLMGYLLAGLVHRKPNKLLRALYTLGGGVAGNRLSESYIGVKRGTKKMVPNEKTGKGEPDISGGNGTQTSVSQPSPVTKLIKENPNTADAALFGGAGLVHGAKGGVKAWDKAVKSVHPSPNNKLSNAPSYKPAGMTSPVSGIAARLAMGRKGGLLSLLGQYNWQKSNLKNFQPNTREYQDILDEMDRLYDVIDSRYSKPGAPKSRVGKAFEFLTGKKRYNVDLNNPSGVQVTDKKVRDVVGDTLNSGTRKTTAGAINGAVHGTLAAVLANLVSPRTVSRALDWIPGLQTEKH